MAQQKATEITLYHQFQKIYVLLDDGDRRVLRQADLTPSQYNLLRILKDKASVGHTITDIADSLLCTRGNATRMVRRLQAMGLVETSDDAADQRKLRVHLSPLGEQQLKTAVSAHNASLLRRFESLSPNHKKQLSELLSQVEQLLETELGADRSE